jgi:hypothetical protein
MRFTSFLSSLVGTAPDGQAGLKRWRFGQQLVSF